MRRIFRSVVASVIALSVLVTGLSPAEAQRRRLIRDAEIEATIRDLATPLFQAAGLNLRAVDIYIVEDNALNAFVAGGQNLFLHTGLLLQTEDPLELVGVIAHEVGHIAGGHLARTSDAIRTASKSAIVALVLGAAAAVASGQAGAAAAIAIGGQNVAQRSFLEYSRAQESAADQAALRFLDQAHLSAGGLVSFLETLSSQELLSSSRRPAYLNTHPLTRDRIDSVEAHLARSAFKDAPLDPELVRRHTRLVAKLYAFLKAPAQTFRKYPSDDTSVPARYAQAIAYYELPDLPKALKLVRGLIADYPNDPYFHELEGQILFESGFPADAVAPYRRAQELAPEAGQIQVALAQALLALNQPDADAQALTYLETAIKTEAEWGFAWRQLAIALGRTGRLGESALALAEQAMRNGRWRDAELQAKRAQAQMPAGTPAALRALDIEEQAKRQRADQN